MGDKEIGERCFGSCRGAFHLSRAILHGADVYCVGLYLSSRAGMSAPTLLASATVFFKSGNIPTSTEGPA